MKYDKRIKTYHGIPVPPWRHEPVGKTMTFVFVVQGRIPSKKNELVGVVDRTDAFEFLNSLTTYTKKDCITMLFKTFARIKNSKEYEKWEAETVVLLTEQLRSQQPAAEKNGLVFPLAKATIKTRFYWKGKYKRDNSNKSEGLHDALVKAHILLDDSYQVMPESGQGAKDYSDEIVNSLAVMYVTTPI